MLEFGLRLTLHNKVKKGGLLKKSLDREKETEKGERDKKVVSDITGGGEGTTHYPFPYPQVRIDYPYIKVAG